MPHAVEDLLVEVQIVSRYFIVPLLPRRDFFGSQYGARFTRVHTRLIRRFHGRVAFESAEEVVVRSSYDMFVVSTPATFEFVEDRVILI
jgi:hypothetical protein